ncbi:MAG: hypothetical protein IJ379_03750 [Lachnospiraceae bacterium]|nr:hypothetical protein [Lachnospiraceae bacterium]
MSEIIIEINGGTICDHFTADTYTYKYRKNDKNFVTLICQPQYCTIKYTRRSDDLTFDDVLFANTTDASVPNLNPLFRDAMRKLNILHIVKYDYILDMKKIKITIDGTRSKTYDKSSHLRFPFYYTSIPKGSLGLYRLQKLDGLSCAPWNNPCLIKRVLETTQSDAEKDFLFIAMYSYLAGKNQEHEYNKFVYYWSAINAMGQYLPQIYNFFQGANNPKWNSTLSKFVRDPSQDAVVLRALAYIINKNDENFSSTRLDGDIKKMEKNSVHMLRYEIKNIDKNCDSLSELYQAAYEYETGTSVADSENAESYPKILEFIDNKIKQKEDIFTFFLLWYPYYWRNHYIHATRTIPVFYTYSDVETIVLKTINYFMENYIGTTLPHWFVLDEAISTKEPGQIDEEIMEELKGMQKSLEKMVESYKNHNKESRNENMPIEEKS